MLQYFERISTKIIFIGLVTFLSISKSFSQDLLVKMNGDTLSISIIEIQESFLVYHKLDVDTERVFTTHRRKLDRIIYENGKQYIFAEESVKTEEEYVQREGEMNVKDDVLESEYLVVKNGFITPSFSMNGVKLGTNHILKLYEENETAERLYRKGKNQNFFGNFLGVPSGFIIGYQFGEFLQGRDTNPKLFWPSLVVGVISVVLNVKGVNNIKKSAKVYNSDLRRPEGIELGMQSTDSGFGLVLSF